MIERSEVSAADAAEAADVLVMSDLRGVDSHGVSNMFRIYVKDYFAAYNIAAFTDLNQFKQDMDRMLAKLRTTKPAESQTRVLYPGLSEDPEILERRRRGIPLHKEVTSGLRALLVFYSWNCF